MPTPVTHRSILAVAGFRRLLAVRVTSQVSDGWFQAGLVGTVLFNPDHRSSPLEIVIGFAVLLLPYSLLGPYVGVFLDRWDRRTSLAAANIIRAVLVLPTAALLWIGYQGIWFAISALLVIGANRFFLAGLSASLPMVVEDEKLVPANALAATLGTICFSVGLFTSASVIALDFVGGDSHGYGAIASLASVGYLISGLQALALFKRGDLGPLAHERHTGKLLPALVEVGRGMIAGGRHIMQRRRAARAMALQTAYRVLIGVLTLSVLLLYSRYFGEGSTGSSQSLGQLAQIIIAGAAGAAGAAIITPLAVRRMTATRWLIALVIGVGVVVLVCGLPFVKELLLVAAFLTNVASQSMKILVDTSIQHECDDLYRGRIFSVNDTLYNLALVSGLFIAAVLLPANGKSAVGLISVAVGFFLLAASYAYVELRKNRVATA